MTEYQLIKSAGEHWVCAVLSRYGWAATLTRDGLERTDILAVQTKALLRPRIEIQVKTTRGTNDKGRWRLGEKSQLPSHSNAEWYALVMLHPYNLNEAPRTFIVPRDHVAAAAWIGHMNWVNDPNRRPGTRNSGPEWSRPAAETFLSYENGWKLLDKPTDQVPVMLPAHYRDLAIDPNVGLPPGHPWKQEMPNWQNEST